MSDDPMQTAGVTRRRLESRRTTTTTVAVLVGVAVFIAVAFLIGPSEERSPAEWGRLGPIRATWEFGKDLVPPVLAFAAFWAVSRGMRRNRPREAGGAELVK